VTLDIPELWKLYCDLFAQKTNPHYEEVRKMIFQLTPDDALKAIKSVSDDFPEAMEKIFGRVPEEQRVRTIDMALPNISEERRIEVFNAFIRQIPEEQRIDTLKGIKTLIPEAKLKKWAREILDGDKQKSTE